MENDITHFLSGISAMILIGFGLDLGINRGAWNLAIRKDKYWMHWLNIVAGIIYIIGELAVIYLAIRFSYYAIVNIDLILEAVRQTSSAAKHTSWLIFAAYILFRLLYNGPCRFIAAFIPLVDHGKRKDLTNAVLSYSVFRFVVGMAIVITFLVDNSLRSYLLW